MKLSGQPTSKEQVQALRQAKRAAKHKVQDSARLIIEPPPTIAAVISKPPTVDSVIPKSSNTVVSTPPSAAALVTKSREDILVERELKKKAKLAGKQKHSVAPVAATSVVAGETNSSNVIVPIVIVPTKVVLSKSERRAKQEAQRMAKSESTPLKPMAKTSKDATAKNGVDTSIVTVRLFPYFCN